MMIIRVGIVQFFFLRTPLLANQNATHVGTSYMVRRSSLKNGIVLSSTLPQPAHSSIFMPVSRIISQCATVNQTLQMDFGEDHVCIALPLKRQNILL